MGGEFTYQAKWDPIGFDAKDLLQAAKPFAGLGLAAAGYYGGVGPRHLGWVALWFCKVRASNILCG